MSTAMGFNNFPVEPYNTPEPVDWQQLYIGAIVRAEKAEGERAEALVRLANIRAAGGW